MLLFHYHSPLENFHNMILLNHTLYLHHVSPIDGMTTTVTIITDFWDARSHILSPNYILQHHSKREKNRSEKCFLLFPTAGIKLVPPVQQASVRSIASRPYPQYLKLFILRLLFRTILIRYTRFYRTYPWWGFIESNPGRPFLGSVLFFDSDVGLLPELHLPPVL